MQEKKKNKTRLLTAFFSSSHLQYGVEGCVTLKTGPANNGVTTEAFNYVSTCGPLSSGNADYEINARVTTLTIQACFPTSAYTFDSTGDVPY